MSARRVEICSYCGGDGSRSSPATGEPEQCHPCHGRGMHRSSRDPCPSCDRDDDRCSCALPDGPLFDHASPEEWKDLVIDGPHGYHLTWVCLGEGLCGDYDPDDPDDRPVLRADLHIPDNADGLSYATLATTSVSEERLREISRDLFDALPADPRAGGIRSVMERWTWRTSDTPKESPDV